MAQPLPQQPVLLIPREFMDRTFVATDETDDALLARVLQQVRDAFPAMRNGGLVLRLSILSNAPGNL